MNTAKKRELRLKERAKCLDCGRCTHEMCEYYMVQHAIWLTVTEHHERRGMLCVGCLEGRLGAPLSVEDFTDCLLNRIQRISGSMRLRDRLDPHGV